jgi:predicted phage baseplate assembly protein
VPLALAYDRASSSVAANVALATHGEGVAETLGSGNAAAEWPRFSLRQPPLTYVPEPSAPGGVASTLEVRVGELKWHEVPTLYGSRPHERVYTTRRQDDGTTLVQFGDGRTGARLPTGRENVRSTYRKGIGVDGNVRAGQLSLLMTRALGLRSVVNPIAATGGQEPQEMADARENAPLTLLTLDRVVSLRDYRDFARGYAGVGKAHAVWTWDAGTRGVHLTVAGVDGADVLAGSSTQTGLLSALAQFGDAGVPARVVSYGRAPFHLQAVVHCDPDYLPAAVKTAVEAALAARFGFAAQGFGERVALSQVEAVIQGVPRVVWVEVTALHRDDAPATREPWLAAAAPETGADANTLDPAELLTLELRADDIVTQIP